MPPRSSSPPRRRDSVVTRPAEDEGRGPETVHLGADAYPRALATPAGPVEPVGRVVPSIVLNAAVAGPAMTPPQQRKGRRPVPTLRRCRASSSPAVRTPSRPLPHVSDPGLTTPAGARGPTWARDPARCLISVETVAPRGGSPPGGSPAVGTGETEEVRDPGRRTDADRHRSHREVTARCDRLRESDRGPPDRAYLDACPPAMSPCRIDREPAPLYDACLRGLEGRTR